MIHPIFAQPRRSKMERKVTVLTETRQHYAVSSHFVVQQTTQYRDEATLAIRRVIRRDSKTPYEELQIEVSITKRGEKRDTHSGVSFVCSAEIADAIAKACTTVRNPVPCS
jgi:hypothetical protein